MKETTSLLRPGRLEVETDLLLGAEEVLLPAGFATRVMDGSSGGAGAATTPSAIRSASSLSNSSSNSSRAPATAASRGFEAALFESGSAPATSHANAHPSSRQTVQPFVAPAAASPVARRPDHLVEPKPAAAEPHVHVVIEDRISPPLGAGGETDRRSRLEALRTLHAADCPHCTRATGFTNLVFGEGSPDAEIVFVGEAPGETEDLTGRPFVGKAGEKLDEMIRAMGFARGDVYIANVLKARPPENRTPLAQEIERCGPYLLAQLAVIRPKAIVTLGGPATKLLLQSELGITRLRGVLHEVTLGRAEGRPFTVPVMPTFHPAYLLRNYTMEVRKQMWDDLRKALAVLGRTPGVRDGAAN